MYFLIFIAGYMWLSFTWLIHCIHIYFLIQQNYKNYLISFKTLKNFLNDCIIFYYMEILYFILPNPYPKTYRFFSFFLPFFHYKNAVMKIFVHILDYFLTNFSGSGIPMSKDQNVFKELDVYCQNAFQKGCANYTPSPQYKCTCLKGVLTFLKFSPI